MFKYSEIVSLFHSPTTVNVLEMVGLSFRLLTFVQKIKIFHTLIGRGK